MLKFQILNGNNKVRRTITANTMNSIYNQYKKWSIGQGASRFVECDSSISFGCGYWAGEDFEYYLKQAK
jgi:hypothetical protein